MSEGTTGKITEEALYYLSEIHSKCAFIHNHDPAVIASLIHSSFPAGQITEEEHTSPGSPIGVGAMDGIRWPGLK
ncbi:MAG: hypothetical protein KDC12_10895 [Flavobacteriales bacterium]|nr:hypothetical protein [Flavobacteriales bacterium]